MELLSDVDWESAELFLADARKTNPDEVLIPFQVGYFWMVVSPEFREEISGPFSIREDAEEVIALIEVSRAERHADPYPDRLFPTERMN